MATVDAITTEAIIGLIRDAAQAMADVPGRTPHDRNVAIPILQSVQSRMLGSSGMAGIKVAQMRGADINEAEAVATVLEELALRLGAWLGRETR